MEGTKPKPKKRPPSLGPALSEADWKRVAAKYGRLPKDVIQ